MASSVAVEHASSGARLVIGVGTEEMDSTRKKARAAVKVEMAAAVGVGLLKAAEDQLGLCPFPALKGRLELEWYTAHRCRFGLGKTSCLERRKPVPESESSSSRGNGVSEVRAQATFPSVRDP